MTIAEHAKDDLLDEPATAYIELEDKRFKPEQELAEKYRSFVGEILRLSLGGVAVFSFVDKFSQGSGLARTLAGFGVLAFAASIGCALFFLFDASEALRWYIVGLRHDTESEAHPTNKAGAIEMLVKRSAIVSRCRKSKLWAAVFLSAGAFGMASATVVTMIWPPTPATCPANWQYALFERSNDSTLHSQIVIGYEQYRRVTYREFIPARLR